MMAPHPPLRAGVMAAGFGHRLQATGSPKPLVPIAGRPLIDRVLGSVGEAGAAEVVIIINEHSTIVRDRVEGQTWPFALQWIVQTTPSSMHSFLLVLEALANGSSEPVLISTVDTVVRPGTFGQFVDAARQSEADLTLALTTRIEEDSPLLVRLADMSPRAARRGRRASRDRSSADAPIGLPRSVTAIGAAAAGATTATAGYYFVHPRILAEADSARREGVAALRAFLSRLVHGGYRMQGILMPDSIDVDRPADVLEAEQLLR
jgi:NDP-sugar pyrophosphorylase family protein